ncbi:MAG: N-acetylneuraminate synthase [Hydrogenophaga sp.]|uniref:N-acetylneuraminate synthase n=1 Tax=Hydrogenophaga sp. TaxID=1904254 RepID=UPI002734A084|nr:N-acetylneuraminate synthase [Hydrogenophaga sp.]MDP3625768.1 N-acetylneuraminate synthase [Hydrogenophaga sp.]
MSNAPVYVIAEAGVNHNGSREMAFALVDAAAAAGADAVKFQTFNADLLATASAPKAGYQLETTATTESQHAMLKRLELGRDMHYELQQHASKRGITFLSTAFDTASLKFLMDLDLPLFKVPSGEITNAPLLWQFARTGKPLVLSTGMATLSEVEFALAVVSHGLQHAEEPTSLDVVWRTWSQAKIRSQLSGHVSLLHCTSQYPTPMSEVNLRAMDTLAASFGLPVGYSDHTEGILIPIAAVARGATIIEKHFTLDRNLPGPDHLASLEPDQLHEMVRQIRELAQSMGDGTKSPQPSEWDTKRAARQQVVAARDLQAGAVLTRQDLTTARAGHGQPASRLWDMIGQQTARVYRAGEVIEP